MSKERESPDGKVDRNGCFRQEDNVNEGATRTSNANEKALDESSAVTGRRRRRRQRIKATFIANASAISTWQQEKTAAYGSWFLRLHYKMNTRFFVPLFLNIADHPYRYVITVVLFSFIFPVLSLLSGRFVIESDLDALMAPVGSFPIVQKDWLLDTFGITARSAAIIHANGNNVITEEAVSLAFDIANVIPTLEDYDMWCNVDQAAQPCTMHSISLFWTNREQFENDMSILQSEDEKQAYILEKLSSPTYANGAPIMRDAIFGQHIVREEDDQIVSANSILFTLLIYPSDERSQNGFESDFGNKLGELSRQHDYLNLTLESWTTTTLDEEILETINKDIPLVAASIVSMSVFTAVAMTRWRKNSRNQRFVTSNFALGLGATVAIVLSAITGYGFCTLCGFPLTFMTQMLPFVLFGIGIDDSFLLVGAYYESDPSLPFKARITNMAHLAAPSITATTLTDIVAFAFGASTSVPSTRWLCFYAVICVFIDYVYQITFFVAILVIDHRRANAGRYDLCCCVKAPVLGDQHGGEGTQRTTKSASHLRTSAREVRPTSRRYATIYTDFLLKPATKIFVLFAFVALFVAGAFLAVQVTVNVDETKLTPYNSQTDRFTEDFVTYFEKDDGVFGADVYYHDLDVSDATVRQGMLDFRHDLLGLGSDAYPTFPVFVEDFESFLLQSPNITANMTFSEQLDEFFAVPRHEALYIRTVIRNNETGEVDMIKEGISIARQVTNTAERIEMLSAQRVVTLEQPLNRKVVASSGSATDRMFLFQSSFPLFEHLRILPREITLGLSLSLLAVALIAMIFTPHPTCVLLSVLVITMVVVEIVGILVLSGNSIETPSMVVLIMSIGLVADYCLHIMHAYLHVDSTTRSGRAKLCVEKIGGSVLLGGMSTFLGVSALAFSSGQVFYSFFVLFSSMAALGLGHGLIFLPVVLSYIGPELVVHNNELIVASSHFTMRSSGRRSVVLMEQDGMIFDDDDDAAADEEGGAATVVGNSEGLDATEVNTATMMEASDCHRIIKFYEDSSINDS